jgi:hypothetical protein
MARGTFRLQRTGALTVLCALAVCALLLLAPAHALAASNGEIDGNVLNGTTGGKPLAGQAVALILQVGAGQQRVATTTTDAAGNFHFTGLATDQQDIYAASVTYEGATYTSDPISLAGDAHPPAITVLAYDATASPAQLGVGRVTLLIEKPSIDAGTIRVVELFTMVNAGNQTFVGQPSASGGMPTGLLRFALPDGYTNLLAQDGFGGGQIIQVNRGFASTAPVLPGQSQFSFSFTYPYDGTHASLAYEAVYPTVQVVVLAPPDVSLSLPGAKSLGTVSASGGKMQVWQAGPLLADKTATVSMSGLPVPGQRPDFDPIWLYIVTGFLALVAFALVVYHLRRFSLSRSMPAAIATAPERLARDEKADDLLRALARLDREHDERKLDDLAYRVQREALKNELKARLAQSSQSALAGAGEAR